MTRQRDHRTYGATALPPKGCYCCRTKASIANVFAAPRHPGYTKKKKARKQNNMAANIPVINRQRERLHSRWRRSSESFFFFLMLKPQASFPSLMVQPSSSTSYSLTAETAQAVWEITHKSPLVLLFPQQEFQMRNTESTQVGVGGNFNINNAANPLL